jgi:hypothetical protein
MAAERDFAAVGWIESGCVTGDDAAVSGDTAADEAGGGGVTFHILLLAESDCWQNDESEDSEHTDDDGLRSLLS